MLHALIENLVQLPFAWDLLLKSTVILMAAWGMHLLLAHSHPRWRVLLWRGVLVSLLLIPITLLVLPAVDVALLPAPSLPTTTTYTTSTPTSETVAPETVPIHTKSWQTTFLAHQYAGWTILWLMVAAAYILRSVLASFRFHQKMQDTREAPPELIGQLKTSAAQIASKKRVELRIASWSRVPFLIGIRKPCLVIPERMAEEDYREELPAVLAHELAHLRAGDLVWMGLGKIVKALLWFHPLAWRMNAAHEAACEEVCDTVAAGYVGSPQDYSRTLSRIALEMVRKTSFIGGLPMARTAKIHRRLQQLKRGLTPLPIPRWCVTLSLIVGCLAIVGLSTLQVGYAESQQFDQLQLSGEDLDSVTLVFKVTSRSLQEQDESSPNEKLVIGENEISVQAFEFDSENNKLTLMGTLGQLQKAKQIILKAKHQAPPPEKPEAKNKPQILIEALISNCDESVAVDESSAFMVAVPTPGSNTSPTITHILSPDEFNKLKETLQKKKFLLSAPKVLTLDKHQATIQSEGGNTEYSLTITPTIQDKNTIILDVVLEFKETVFIQEEIYQSRAYKSIVRIKAGDAIETLVKRDDNKDFMLIVKADIIEE